MEFPTLHTSPNLAKPAPPPPAGSLQPPRSSCALDFHPHRTLYQTRLNHPRAFTLAESLIASVVLALCVVGVAGALACSSQQSLATDEAAITTALGKQLLEEIASKPFPIAGVTTNPGWTSGNHNRATYDDVSDYNGYTDSTPITTLSGITINPGGTYTRSVVFQQRVNPSDTPGDGDFGLITVSVTGPSGATTLFSRLVANVTTARPTTAP
jgi:hypothetical protein